MSKRISKTRFQAGCAVLSLAIFAFLPSFAAAHFGMVLPSKAVVSEGKDASLTLALQFWHPFENVGMNLARPAAFTLYRDGKTVDLLPALKAQKVRGFDTWSAPYKVERPGLYSFVMTPAPYWEPAEDCFIIHYTKVMVPAFGDDAGWDVPLGLPVEIVPLSKPFAQYAGNLFQGRVLMNGKPVPGAEVEVEFYPGDKSKGVAPNELMVTQTIRADDAGIFSYAAPCPGWWGFAALQESPDKMNHEGTPKNVELGGVIWVHFEAMQKPVPVK